jgi:hypothetical protein
MDWRQQNRPSSDGAPDIGGRGFSADTDEHVATLDAADERLSSILAEVAELHAELARLREDGDGLVHALAEREAALAAKEQSLSGLDNECAEARRQLEATATALAEANALLGEQRMHVATLGGQLQALRASMAERDRRLAKVEAELSGAKSQLAQREQALVQERSRVQTAQQALAEVQRRSEGLSKRLETDARERERLRSGLGARERTRGSDGGEPDPVPISQAAAHLRFVPQPSGYALSESSGPLPSLGEVIELGGRRFAVAKLGRSPLPGDTRTCVFLSREVGPTPRSSECRVSAGDDMYAAARRTH